MLKVIPTGYGGEGHKKLKEILKQVQNDEKKHRVMLNLFQHLVLYLVKLPLAK